MRTQLLFMISWCAFFGASTSRPSAVAFEASMSFLVAFRCHIQDFLFFFLRCCYAPADFLSACPLGWELEVNLNNKLLALRRLSLSGTLCNNFIFNKLERVCFCFAS